VRELLVLLARGLVVHALDVVLVHGLVEELEALGLLRVAEKLLALLLDVGKLTISLWRLDTTDLLGIGFQRIVMGLEEAADHGFADRVVAQAFLNVAQPTVEPFVAVHRVASGMRRDDFQQLRL
jgi:hypothetical protein